MGTLITAVTIALTTQYLQLSRSESKVVGFLKKDSNKQMVHESAARSVQSAYRFYAAKAAMSRGGKKGGTQRAAALERRMFDQLRIYRATKRYVLAHDGSDPVDKQITLLETMEVNVDDIKRKIEGLEEAVGAYEANVGAAGAIVVAAAAGAEGGAAAGSASGGAGPPSSRQGAAPPAPESEKPPDWAVALEELLKGVDERVGKLKDELKELQGDLASHVERTEQRLGTLERAPAQQ